MKCIMHLHMHAYTYIQYSFAHTCLMWIIYIYIIYATALQRTQLLNLNCLLVSFILKVIWATQTNITFSSLLTACDLFFLLIVPRDVHHKLISHFNIIILVAKSYRKERGYFASSGKIDKHAFKLISSV